MIKPTVGRVVWYHPSTTDQELARFAQTHDGRPFAATIAHVWSDTCVNLSVLDPNGNHYSRTSVYLSNGDAQTPSAEAFCEWMPYQKGQAAKAEAAERQLAAAQEPPARPTGRLATLRRLVDDARQLAAGGLHANCADPTADAGTLGVLVEAVRYLNLAAKELEQAPDFVVAHGAAGLLPAPGGE